MIAIPGTAPLPHDIWETIIDYAAPQNITGLTPLLVFTNYGVFFRSLAVHMYNADGALPCQLVVDVSHGGLVRNPDYSSLIDIDATSEGMVEMAPPNPFTYIRVYGMTDGSTVSIKWALLGMRR